MQRPDFDSIKSFEDFSKYYWYRDELIKICKAHGLKAPSGKIELYKVIEAYFAGDSAAKEDVTGKKITTPRSTTPKSTTPKSTTPKSTSPKSTSPRGTTTKAGKKKALVTQLTLQTGLIECGFTFGPKFRNFFIEQTGEEKFKFNVDMVATAKKVKETGDESFTLGELLDIYYGKKTYAIYDKSALLWNKFVHDFCEDDATKGFENRLKAAAALWAIVRDSDRKKEYSHELLEEFKGQIGGHKHERDRSENY